MKKEEGKIAKTETTKTEQFAAPATITSQTSPQKKSNKSCFIIIVVVVVFILFSSARGLAFLGLGFLPWSKSNTNNNFPIVSDQNDPVLAPEAVDTPTKTDSKKSTPPSSSPSASSSPAAGNSSGVVSSIPPSSSTTAPQPPAGSQPTPPPAAQAETVFTKQQQIDFFVQIAMKNDQNNFYTAPIIKWTSNSGTVKYYNNPTGANLACADETINLINGLSNTIHFQKTTSTSPNVRVFFVPKSQIGAGIGGYYNLSTGTNGQITGGDAYVPIDAYGDVDRCHYIRHEMIHVMTGLVYNGLRNRGGYDFSIFNVAAGRSDLLEIDKSAIKIMLNSGVQLHWNESQVRSFLATATW